MLAVANVQIDGTEWTLDLRPGEGKCYEGPPKGDATADLTLTISDADFAKLVSGKLNPQQVGVRAWSTG